MSSPDPTGPAKNRPVALRSPSHLATPTRTAVRINALRITAALICALTMASHGLAQNAESTSLASLPDAPSFALADAQAAAPPPSATNSYTAAKPYTSVAPVTQKYIPAGVQASPLTARDKVDQTAHDLYTPESFIGFAFAAGYSQLVRGQPNYGSDPGAFGQRLGAAAIRDSSQDIFQGMVFAPLLHDDPRYYVEGDGYSFPHRLFYAITRPLITRGDHGNERVNGSLLLGYAAAAGLTDAYYPGRNRNARDTASTFGASIGGAAVGFAYHEFRDDALRLLHRHHDASQ